LTHKSSELDANLPSDDKLREEIEDYLGLAVHFVQVNANETDVYVLGLQKYTEV
jgi:hypothetical protein